MPITNPKYRLTRTMVAGAPDDEGVYALWDDGELIYLGRASPAASIRARLIDHVERPPCPCTARATHYSWELSLRPAAREMELLEQFKARFGRLPRCNDKAA